MTGIERLRAIAGAWDEWGLGGTLAEIADQIERERDAEVADSPYDAILPEDRDALAWVRDHGGLDSVKRLLDWVVGHCSTKQQLDFDFWLSGRVMHELGFEEDMADRDEVERRLLARLMPEGYKWPRYESGEPLRYEDRYVYDGREREVWHVDFDSCGEPTILNKDGTRSHPDKGERVKRPTVPASDGEPLEVGQTVWDTDAEADTPLTVVEVSSDLVRCEYTWKDGKTYRPCYPPDQLTHQRPDSWERVEDDATLSPEVYCHRNGIDISKKDGTEIFLADTVEPMARDLVRRCRALAERERGE